MLKLIQGAAVGRQRSTLDEEALEWVVRLTSGETNSRDHDAFRAWRDRSAAHGQALARARRLWTRLGPTTVALRQRRAARRRHLAVGLPLAACLALGVGLGDRYLSIWRYDQVTESGRRRMVILPDGSQMTLSGRSAVNLDFHRGVRRVDLARGEALFRVVHDASRPFVVHTGDEVVRDLGTTFDIARTPDGIRVVVAEGRVEVSCGDHRTLLSPNQSMTIAGGVHDEIEPVDATIATGWTGGRLVLENRTLADIVSAIRPHYAGRIFLLNPHAGNRRLSVAIDLDHIDDWLRGLASTKAVRMTRLGDTVVLT